MFGLEPGTDSVEVALGLGMNTAVAAEGLDTVVSAMVEQQTGVAVGTGTVAVEKGLGTDIAVEG